MRVKGALSFTVFAVVIVLVFGYFAKLGVGFTPPSQRTRVSMSVPDINGLVVGSSVQLRGVPIGEIESISATKAGAVVNFYFDSRYKIPVDSNVRLENLSAAGEAYIGIIPRSERGPALQDGQRISTAAITLPPSISELATTVVRVLNQLDPRAMGSIISEVDTALPDPTTVLPNLSRASLLLRNTAANMNGKGRELLDNFQILLKNAEFVGPVLADSAPPVKSIGDSLCGVFLAGLDLMNRGSPANTRHFVNYIGRIERFLDHSGGDIKVLTQSMLPYLNDLSGALMNLDTGQVFSNMLAAVPEEGAVTLHVTIPGAGVTDNAGDVAPNPSTGAPAGPETPVPAASAPRAPTR